MITFNHNRVVTFIHVCQSSWTDSYNTSGEEAVSLKDNHSQDVMNRFSENQTTPLIATTTIDSVSRMFRRGINFLDDSFTSIRSTVALLDYLNGGALRTRVGRLDKISISSRDTSRMLFDMSESEQAEYPNKKGDIRRFAAAMLTKQACHSQVVKYYFR